MYAAQGFDVSEIRGNTPSTQVVDGVVPESGPRAPLGAVTIIESTERDRVIAYVLISSGARVGDNDFVNNSLYITTPANYEAVITPANTGAQGWRLIRNDSVSAIPRGTPLKYVVAGGVTGAFSVAAMAAGDHPDECIGVLQWVLPAASSTWAVCLGYGKALCTNANCTDGTPVGFGVSGDARDALLTSPSNGRALAAVTAGAGVFVPLMLSLKM